MRDDRVRLEDIVEAAEAIEKYAVRGRHAFDSDELVQTWIVRHLQIIGEAERGLSPAFRERYPDEIWTRAIGMRNIVVHRYFAMDPDAVWDAIERGVRQIKAKAQTIPSEVR
ncbi:MAG: DUF86 domain-containing protein [Acidobacteria bacterium]|nr:DUF86 domain-containing protein [Acidobacteriota bacterium]